MATTKMAVTWKLIKKTIAPLLSIHNKTNANKIMMISASRNGKKSLLTSNVGSSEKVLEKRRKVMKCSNLWKYENYEVRAREEKRAF